MVRDLSICLTVATGDATVKAASMEYSIENVEKRFLMELAKLPRQTSTSKRLSSEWPSDFEIVSNFVPNLWISIPSSRYLDYSRRISEKEQMRSLNVWFYDKYSSVSLCPILWPRF